MDPRLSRRAATVTPSPIRTMTLECRKVGGVNLAQGICDVPPPPEVLEEAHAALDAGFHIYTRMDGLDSMRAVIARDLERRGIPAAPDDGRIVVSIGATGAFYCACLATLDPGDELLLLEPYYGYHLGALRAADGAPVFVPLRGPDFALDLDALRDACTPRTRALMVCTPANPCGKVFTREELEGIRDLAVERDLLVFTDEIYEHFVYDGREHLAPATLEGLAERTVTIGGYSKTFSITGWRIGYAHAPEPIARALAYFNDAAYVCAPAPLQEAVARAHRRLPENFFRGIRDVYQRKRDRICGALAEAGLTPHVPQGAYYVLADIGHLPGEDSQAKVMHLLRETKVAAVPGESFWSRPEDGRHLARFCFAKTDEDLERAVAGLRELA